MYAVYKTYVHTCDRYNNTLTVYQKKKRNSYLTLTDMNKNEKSPVCEVYCNFLLVIWSGTYDFLFPCILTKEIFNNSPIFVFKPCLDCSAVL